MQVVAFLLCHEMKTLQVKSPPTPHTPKRQCRVTPIPHPSIFSPSFSLDIFFSVGVSLSIFWKVHPPHIFTASHHPHLLDVAQRYRAQQARQSHSEPCKLLTRFVELRPQLLYSQASTVTAPTFNLEFIFLPSLYSHTICSFSRHSNSRSIERK